MSAYSIYRAHWRAAIVTAASTALLAGHLVVIAAAAAAKPAGVPSDPCPAPYPVAELENGMVATGITVERGVNADEFTATIVGVIDDGIAPDVDMIIAETDSPAIERAGGIWAGMSGSPVYAPDGRLIGAVAYGLSAAPSNIAGITPAAAMEELLLRPAAGPTAATSTVSLPSALQQELVGSGAASVTEAKSGLRRLPTPVAVSGVSNDRIGAFGERLATHIPGARAYRASAASPTSSSSVADIFPGSNFAAAISYGDLTAAGIGTTTAVCDGDRALAFGHPFLWSGRSSMSVHPASAVYVQRDNTFGSFKLANPQGVVGRSTRIGWRASEGRWVTGVR